MCRELFWESLCNSFGFRFDFDFLVSSIPFKWLCISGLVILKVTGKYETKQEPF